MDVIDQQFKRARSLNRSLVLSMALSGNYDLDVFPPQIACRFLYRDSKLRILEDYLCTATQGVKLPVSIAVLQTFAANAMPDYSQQMERAAEYGDLLALQFLFDMELRESHQYNSYTVLAHMASGIAQDKFDRTHLDQMVDLVVQRHFECTGSLLAVKSLLGRSGDYEIAMAALRNPLAVPELYDIRSFAPYRIRNLTREQAKILTGLRNRRICPWQRAREFVAAGFGDLIEPDLDVEIPAPHRLKRDTDQEYVRLILDRVHFLDLWDLLLALIRSDVDPDAVVPVAESLARSEGRYRGPYHPRIGKYRDVLAAAGLPLPDLFDLNSVHADADLHGIYQGAPHILKEDALYILDLIRDVRDDQDTRGKMFFDWMAEAILMIAY